jgi:serine O-acetyltransferase
MMGAMADPGFTAFLRARFTDHRACVGCPTPDEVGRFFDELLGLLFPPRANRSYDALGDVEAHAEGLRARLSAMLEHVPCRRTTDAASLAHRFFAELPTIFAALERDVTATFEGDPAATSRNEVIRSYPGFYAIAAYRIAHALQLLGVPLLPRMVTEHAHGRTGIDIHPSATIGHDFCIDHGTGVVIGETAEIGHRVKIYQGVTLGGLSVRKEDARTKRHPTIEDDVVLYAGATILGGSTRIGRGSVIGGNVWLTRSVPPGSKVTYLARLQGLAGEPGDEIAAAPLAEALSEPQTEPVGP